MAKFILNLDGPSIKLPESIQRASFDYVSRYQLIAEIITRYFEDAKNPPKNILDVGGLGSFISQIINIPTTIFDNEVVQEGTNQILGDGTSMNNIEDGAFDVVITSDTLEHIPKKQRRNFINELVRTSNDLIILCAPFADQGAIEEEKKLQHYYKEVTGKPHRWLKEHKQLGLPLKKEIIGYFDKNNISYITLSHNSLDIWTDLLSINLLTEETNEPGMHKLAEDINQFYNQNLLFKDFKEKSYRMFIVASKKRELAYEMSQQKPAAEDMLQLFKLSNQFYLYAIEHTKQLPSAGLMGESFRLIQRKMVELQANHKQLYSEHNHLLSSKTWRYSEFGRKIVRMFRRIRGRKNRNMKKQESISA